MLGGMGKEIGIWGAGAGDSLKCDLRHHVWVFVVVGNGWGRICDFGWVGQCSSQNHDPHPSQHNPHPKAPRVCLGQIGIGGRAGSFPEIRPTAHAVLFET